MNKLSFILVLAILRFNSYAQNNSDYYVQGVSNPVINLNGAWKINTMPTGDFWLTDRLDDNWKEIQVPGECMMQGLPIKHNEPFAYKKMFEIPADFKNKVIKLRFEGVYSYARIWINGKYIRDHSGGFTSWDCDITSAVKPGTAAMLTVEVTDKPDEISYASGYAKHQIGGILRNVNLLAMPDNYPENVLIITDLDENYRNAKLTITGKLKKSDTHNEIKLELFDKLNQKVNLSQDLCAVSDTIFLIENQLFNPMKWEAEHPNLYRLKISFLENGNLSCYKYHTFGFREIEIKGNKFLINGSQVKLRGACRHDIHPLLGRVSTPDYELMDVLLAKEANINFIRTSHYPPTDHFLQLCDEYGIYVEDETAVCFVGSHRTAEYFPGSSENSPDFTQRYLSQLSEMVNSHRNHPSVIIWSIGNENSFGYNFKKSYDWVKANDPTRPVIFSYPGMVPDSIRAYDIISMHYPGIDGNMEQYGKVSKSFGHAEMPVIFDEWAHVACYNNFTVKEDPNIRDFWGMSLDSMWQKTYNADGGLGGAIWGMIDETFMLPEDLPGFNEWWGKIDEKVIPGEYKGNTIGYGEWGIVDIWRRKKPEFWNTKKAYSPVRILKTKFENYRLGSTLEIPIYNRFDHTNLNEITINYTYKGLRQTLPPTDLQPHSMGKLLIPLSTWDAKEPILVEVLDSNNLLIDSYALRLDQQQTDQIAENTFGKIDLTEDDERVTINCESGVEIQIDKNTGLFTQLKTKTESINFSGPYLNLRTKGKSVIYSSHQINDYSTGWKLKILSFKNTGNDIIVSVKGEYSDIPDVEFIIQIGPEGSISINYDINYLPKEYIRELGIKYIIDDVADSLSWKRKTYWSVYPTQHLSATEGKVSLYTDIRKLYRHAPGKPWEYDTKSFYYNGIRNEADGDLTNIARASKENIIEYNLHMKNGSCLSVSGFGSTACRIAKNNRRIELFINDKMDYPDLSWGNYQRDIMLAGPYKGKVKFTFIPGMIK